MKLFSNPVHPHRVFATTEQSGGTASELKPPAKEDKKPKKQVQPTCTCGCLTAWVAAIAAPYVPKLPNTTTTTWPALPPFQTETETGEEFWSADVNMKTYDCNTKVVAAQNAAVLSLAHNDYSRSRTRNLGLGGWGAWTAWGAFANTGNYNDARALATSAPPVTHCPNDGVPCP
ncbi:MAG: hypothetical protein ACI92Z_003273 [Paracoccaceae bacterium]|jgi:hypothetical protein